MAQLAAQHFKRVLLELGGNSAQIVLRPADVETAAAAGDLGSFLHQGQICTSTNRHLLHESLADDYAVVLAEKARALKVGNPAADDLAGNPGSLRGYGSGQSSHSMQ
ncbi:aldehyde dehydrogenase family protein [Arthrobacter sp. NyZ413]|uniref:aldehyde dehydrogenase family protein n=1 Tax=Arthrobacter sp. NyZ413 TaxID=3144669 RepID=UPI003BF8216E